jgi:two-component system chemotaxis sensor kinase CheA
MSGLPLVAESMREGHGSAVWTDERGIYQVHAQRMQFGETVVGHLLVGRAIDDKLAQTVLRHTGSSVLIMSGGKTVGAAVQEGHDPVRVAELLGALEKDGSASELSIDGERFVAVVRTVPGYEGSADVRFVVLRSLDAALAATERMTELLYLVGAIGFGMAIVLSIAMAWRVSAPMDRLVAFTERIAAGELSARTDPRGAKEIRTLGHAMNRMAEQLASSKDEIERINAGLERTVAERTAELGEMLDNLQDGLFFIDEAGQVVGLASPACASILGCEPAGHNIEELLFAGCAVDSDRLAAHRFSLQSSFGAPSFQWELNNTHLVRALDYTRTDGSVRALELRYAPLYDEHESVARVMIIVSDVTQLRELERIVETEQAKNQERMGILLEVLRCQSGQVVEFVDDNSTRAMRIVEDVGLWRASREREALRRAFRELHTIKGNARMLELGRVAALTHEVEEVVQVLRDDEHASRAYDTMLTDRLERLFVLLDEYRTVVEKTLRGRDATGLVKAEKIAARLTALAATLGPREELTANSLHRLADLAGAESREEVASVDELFAHHLSLSRDIADKLGKEIRFDEALEPGRDLYVRPPVARVLRDAANHAIRNALDHGIETPEERTAVGKPRAGRIWLAWREQGDGFSLTIRDDGRGLDPDALVRVARARGLVTDDAMPTGDAITELLFLPGFSTKSVVTDVSGRGVGLDAIRAIVRELGGDVRLVSERGRGSALELQLPRSAVVFTSVAGRVDRVTATADLAAA